jgi:hypothetical protein
MRNTGCEMHKMYEEDAWCVLERTIDCPERTLYLAVQARAYGFPHNKIM